MTVIGFHASHEQVHPGALLHAVQRAEEAGFTAAMCSDHFAPWSQQQGHSGFAWAWLGAALQASTIPIGVVNAPGQRYHPAIIAQAAATLEAMFPDRFWAALGSGEAINEHITGSGWPAKERRNARLEESVTVIRSMLAGQEVTYAGEVTVDRARLWTLPEHPPPLLGAAVSAETAGWVANWADGLATVLQAPDALRSVIDAYRSNGGTGPLVLQIHLSYASTDEEALAIAHDQWRTNVFSPPLCWDLDMPEAFEIAAEYVTPDSMHGVVNVSSDTAQHVAWLQQAIDFGFDEIYLHHVGKEQNAFIDTFGERVLPQLNVTRKVPA